MRHLFPLPPQPLVDLQTKVSFASTRAPRKRFPSIAAASAGTTFSAARSAMPRAPTVPGLGGTITSAPVWRATAAASASEAKGMPWQKMTSPTERLPFTRFR